MKSIRKYLMLLSLFFCMLIALKTSALAAATTVDLSLNGSWMENTISGESDIIMYRLVLPSDGRVDLTFQAYRNNTAWTMVDPDLNYDDNYLKVSISSASVTSPTTITRSLYLSKGTYYIKAADNLYWSFAGEGKIRIKGSFTSGLTTEIEPNDTFAQAMSLAANKTVRGILTERDDRLDFYKIQVPEQGNVVFRMLGMFSVGIVVYNSEYTKIMEGSSFHGTVDSPKTTSWTKALSAGTYYIKVIDSYSNSDPSGLYELSWWLDIPVSSVRMSETLSLTAGSSKKLEASVLPSNATDKTLVWSTSRSSVATVDSTGKVTAKAVGTAVITATAQDGSKVAAKCTVTVTEKIEPPAKVTGLTSYAEDRRTTSIKLRWSKASGATGYRVYKYDSASSSYKKYKDTSKTTITVSGLEPYTKYAFKVKAYKKVDGTAAFGTASDSYKVYTALDKLAVPKNLTSEKATREPNSITLSWSSVEHASRYRVYIYSSDSKSYEKYADTSGTMMKVTGLEPEKKYAFKVKAYTLVNGEVMYSKASASHKAYTAPKQLKTSNIKSVQILKETNGQYVIKLKWNKVYGATGYHVYYKSEGVWKLLKTVKTNSAKTKLSIRKSRYYKVVAYRSKNGLTTDGTASAAYKYTAE